MLSVTGEQFDVEAVVSAVRGGDLSAYRSLVTQYQRLVISHFARALTEDHLVEELTQDTFVTAFEKLRQYRGDGFAAWLMAIARSKLLMYLRSKQRRLSALERLRQEIVLTVDEHAERADDEVTRRQIERMRTCLERLPDATRELVQRCYLEQASVREVAQALDRSEDSVRSVLYRGRRQLRACMLEAT